MVLVLFRVEKTAKKYSLTIGDLTTEDDGSKFVCKHNDGEDTKSLQTYRLKLKAAEPTAAPTLPPTMPALPVVVVTDVAPVDGKKRVNDDGTSNEIEEEEKDLEGKDGKNGAINASLSSALAASLLIVYTLSL